MDNTVRLTVLRQRSDLSRYAAECADLALDCVEPSRLHQFRYEGTRCILAWANSRLVALFPFGAPRLHREAPLVVLSAPTPLLRRGSAEACVHALLDWFRHDGEGAALIEIRGLAPFGPVYRAFSEVARQREQFALCVTQPDGSRTLIVSERSWDELSEAMLPLQRWAKRRVANLLRP